MIVIQTRWHADDLAGRLINESATEYGEKWQRADLAAIAGENDPIGRPPGGALWPERFSREHLDRIKLRLGSYSFSALYQQQPMPDGGGIFRKEWFTRRIAREPAGLNWVRGYDLAVSTKTSADYTASFRCAFGPSGDLYISGGFRDRMEYPDQRRYVIERVRQEKNTIHAIESAIHGQALVQDLSRETKTRGRPFRSVRVDRDKVTRANSWAGIAEAGKVVLVEGPWIDEFLAEVATFPLGKHDDQIDAVSLAVRTLATPKRRSKGF